ncbi:MAG: hypothetical protein ABF586_08965 [Sporolactobacillus sp.]
MSQSKAKRQRSKHAQTGHLNPENSRLTWGFNPFTRRLPTKQERIRKAEQKHKARPYLIHLSVQ